MQSPPALRLIEALGLKSGIVSSGNSLNCGPEDRAALEASGASIKEMEGAAIGYVASLFSVPLLAVKAITDIVDGDRVSGTAGLRLLTAAAALRVLPSVTRRCSPASCAHAPACAANCVRPAL